MNAQKGSTVNQWLDSVFNVQLCNMVRIATVFVLCVTTFLSGAEGVSEMCRGTRCFIGQDWSRPCVGVQCQGRTETAVSRRQSHHSTQSRQGQLYPAYQQDAHLSQAQSAPLTPYTVIQPQQGSFSHPAGTDGTKRTNPRTITAEVFHPGCAGGTCPTTVSHRPTGDDSATRECKGIGCKLPRRMHQKSRTCVGDDCGSRGDDGRAHASPVHVTDRAAQFLDELPDFGSERGAWIQLTCDMKPGTNELPSEDALVLHLQLSKSQDKLVEALRGQQDEVRELQRLLGEQQGTLVNQQREILEQQRRMYDQMEQVKAQYNMMMDSIKQISSKNLQGELDSHMETMSGQVRAHQAQQALSLHKVDMEASVMEVERPLLACGSCGPEEYCGFSSGHPRCEKCTICPAGFFLVAQCSVHTDRICQDRDECLEISDLCGDQQKCLNTPGGFRCQGMTERDANSGMCGHDYFYNMDMDECQACYECDGEQVATPCTFTTDTVCSGPATTGESALSLSWAGHVSLPGTKGRNLAHAFPSVELHIQGRGDAGLLSTENGRLLLRQHGLVWLDENLSVSHGCQSFIQLCLRINNTDSSESRDLSGFRVEQQEGRSIQSASISGVAEVAPGHVISLLIRSTSQHCNQSSEGLQLYDASAAPLSLLWLSHDTGAVAMTAQATVSAHYHTNYRPVFRTTSTSDPYVVGLTHDGRGIRFAESGTVRFVFQQALYSMGQACVSEGFQLLAYLNRNGTGVELCRTFKPGVHYRDTSLSLFGATKVEDGDTLGFEILSPSQCNVRFFGDETGISILSLVWVPAALSSSLTASVSHTGLPSGAVRNKPLFFRQTSAQVSQVALLGKGSTDQRRDFVFRETGTASVGLDLKLIHSCNLVKVTLLRRSDTEGSRPIPVAQQVGGQMPEGSQWASVSMRASFQVHNGTSMFFTLDCVRGRVNQISYQTGSGVSILWVAA